MNNTTLWLNDTVPVYKPNWFRLVVLLPSIAVTIICTFVIFVLLRVRELRSVTNALIVNAAMADWLRGIVGIFNTYMYIRPIPNDTTHLVLCDIFLFLHFAQSFWSNWSMAALAYDRYDLLSRPLNRRLKKKQVTAIIATIVVVAVFISSLPIYSGWSQFLLYPLASNPRRAKCRYTQQETNAFDWSFQPVFDFLAFIVPVVCVVVAYALIVRLVMRHKRRQEQHARNLGRSALTLSSATTTTTTTNKQSEFKIESNDAIESTSPTSVVRSKAFQLVTAVVLTNIVLTLPFVIVAELEKFRVIIIKVFPDRMKSVLMTLFHFNFVVNSVLYLFWIRNAVRMARRKGIQTKGKTVRLLARCC
ncbi:octopamine receptor beta-2R-like [Oscarella lobularis]|uniref:octopamine receptor beta-2R-like n=1 Tax=Oscarella lobularis TaxID=121494 RepID=UPI0033139E91